MPDKKVAAFMDIAYQNISVQLQPFIAGLWATKGHQELRHERIVPDGGSCLIFNFGGAVTARRVDGSSSIWRNNFFAGLTTSYVDLTYEGSFDQVGVIFKPFGAFHLMSLPMSEFLDSGFEVDLIDKEKFQKISDTMAGTECLHQRLAIVSQWLSAAFAGVNVETLVPAVTSLLQRSDEISVNEIANHVGRSQQHIARLFHKYTGINPKKLQRIFRFQKVLQALNTPSSELLTATAYQYDYYDQPHFNNEIRAFSGFTPAQLAKQNVMGSFRVIR